MKLFLALAAAAVAVTSPADALFGSSNKCREQTFSGKQCAYLFDDGGCNGWKYPIETGYVKKLPWLKRNDAESVLVKQGCVLYAYDKKERKGKKATFSNLRGYSALAKDLDGSRDLEEDIESVECRCPGAIGGSGSFGGRYTTRRPSFGGSGSYGGSQIGGSGSYSGRYTTRRPSYGGYNSYTTRGWYGRK